MVSIYDCSRARNRISEQEPDLRRDLARLQARYDSGSVSPAIYAVIRQIEIELGWACTAARCCRDRDQPHLERRHRSCPSPDRARARRRGPARVAPQRPRMARW
jgi:hypothetical protein